MTTRYVILRCADQLLAVDVSSTLQILEPTVWVPVPGSPPHVAGVANIDGQILPVIDLGCRLMGTPNPCPERFCLVETHAGRAILSVDEVLEVASIDDESLHPEVSDSGVVAAGKATLTHWRDEPLEAIVLIIHPDAVCEAA